MTFAMQTAPPLTQRLRAETASSHHRLEARLDLLREPLERSRFLDALCGFYGFHAVWEPAVETMLPGALESRQRLRLLADDLLALGLSGDRIAALPRCFEAARLAKDVPTALGSLYVMEGSTLGGAVIAKALQGAGWAPPAGLRYFSPYGREVAARWRQTLTLLEASRASDEDAMVAAAIDTFRMLERWFTGAEAAAA